MLSSTHLKELLSAPYNSETSISLNVKKQGETLMINKMHPLLGNKMGAQKHLKEDSNLADKIKLAGESRIRSNSEIH